MVDIYRVHVLGHLDDRWSDWIGDMTPQRQADGTTVLVGPVIDQAALYGVITRVRDLGLPLLSVNRDASPSGSTSVLRRPRDQMPP